jgi:hypothetical protein
MLSPVRAPCGQFGVLILTAEVKLGHAGVRSVCPVKRTLVKRPAKLPLGGGA